MQNVCEKLKRLQLFPVSDFKNRCKHHPLHRSSVTASIKNHWSSSQTLKTTHMMYVGSAKSWMEDLFYRYTTSPELFLYNIPIFPEEILYKVKNSYFPSDSKLTYFLNGITLLCSLHVLQGVAWYYVCEYSHKFRLYI